MKTDSLVRCPTWPTRGAGRETRERGSLPVSSFQPGRLGPVSCQIYLNELVKIRAAKIADKYRGQPGERFLKRNLGEGLNRSPRQTVCKAHSALPTTLTVRSPSDLTLGILPRKTEEHTLTKGHPQPVSNFPRGSSEIIDRNLVLMLETNTARLTAPSAAGNLSLSQHAPRSRHGAWWSSGRDISEAGPPPPPTPAPVCKGTDVSVLLDHPGGQGPRSDRPRSRERLLTSVYKTQAVLPGLEPTQQICFEQGFSP